MVVKPLTYYDAVALLRDHHQISLRKTEFDDYRVSRIGDHREANAYYTSDLDDAVATGIRMAQEKCW